MYHGSPLLLSLLGPLTVKRYYIRSCVAVMVKWVYVVWYASIRFKEHLLSNTIEVTIRGLVLAILSYEIKVKLYKPYINGNSSAVKKKKKKDWFLDRSEILDNFEVCWLNKLNCVDAINSSSTNKVTELFIGWCRIEGQPDHLLCS